MVMPPSVSVRRQPRTLSRRYFGVAACLARRSARLSSVSRYGNGGANVLHGTTARLDGDRPDGNRSNERDRGRPMVCCVLRAGCRGIVRPDPV
jgi:hypothetical protein